jgi:hypothetical protein
MRPDKEMRVINRALAADEYQVDRSFGIVVECVSYHKGAMHDIEGRNAACIVYNYRTRTPGGQFAPEYPVEEIIFPPLGGQRNKQHPEKVLQMGGLRDKRHPKIVTAKIVFCKK